MITETTINIYPLLPIIKIAIFAVVIGIFAFLLHNGFIFKSFSKHDNSIIDKFLSKYPDVAPEFMTKGLREQNIENNQEIHAINKRFDEIEGNIKELGEAIKKVIAVMEEINKNG